MLTLRKLNEMKPEFTFLTNKLQRNWLISVFKLLPKLHPIDT